MKILNYFTILMVFFSFHACTDDVSDSSVVDMDKRILTFSSEEEMLDELNSVLEMTSEEKYQWENSREFSSIELAAERFYESIDPEQFGSQKEVFDFVKKYSHFLKLTEDGKGEYELDTRLNGSQLRYFANTDGVFQVNDCIYKVYQEGVVAVQEEMYDVLINSDYQSALSIENHRVVSMNMQSIIKSTNTECAQNTFRADNGNERVRFIHGPAFYDMGSYYHAAAGYEIRGYKRVLGVWYRVTRSLSCDIYMKVIIDSEFFEGWYQKSAYTKVIEGAYKIPNAYFANLGDSYCDAYDSWGKQNNTGKAYAICD